MLRDFAYDPDKKLILEALGKFNIDLPQRISLDRFEVITPDSFMWQLLIDDAVHYLYAEDYVPGLKHIKTVLDRYLDNGTWDFVRPRTVLRFEDSTPVHSATTYAKADDADAMMQYAAESGCDFVFLARKQ